MFSDVDFKKELHDKRINILIGSGASSAALPTLKTGIEKAGVEASFEDIACSLEDEEKKIHSYLLFYEIYYKKLLIPSFSLEYKKDPNAVAVLNNYKELLSLLISLLDLKKVNDNKRCNIFTTNYDGFIEYAADEIIIGKRAFFLNDGGSGFKERILSASTFNLQVKHIGIFDEYATELPTINLIKLHGSIYWTIKEDRIVIDYERKAPNGIPTLGKEYLKNITTYDSIKNIAIYKRDAKKLEEFWRLYRTIPIVNPTKWKFNETVFEQHYYQMLRLLSYELEKRDVYLITFGFSFRDEHICELIKRSLLNPSLTVYIFCYDETSYLKAWREFRNYNNVYFVFKHKENLEKYIEHLDYKVFLDILNGIQNKNTWKVMR